VKIGVVGLGTMGAPMARHLLRAGHDVAVHNRTREREGPLAAEGARRAATPAEAAEGADAVLTCVSDSPDLEAVVLGESGVASGLRSGAVLVDCSTVSPQTAGRVAAALEKRGCLFVDAPVSGGSEGAVNGTLTVFAGGTPEAVEAARPLLEPFSAAITHFGPAGAGQVAKAVNQMAIAGTYAALGEGIALAERAGLPLDLLVDALGRGAADSWVLRNRARNMVASEYPLGFRLALHAKDLRIALEAAREHGVAARVTSLVEEIERELVAAGWGDEDVSALARAPRPPA
jgi:3-hydroxyisobutyrate dehydrogenase